MTQDRIWLSAPHLTGNEIHYIEEAFARNWVSPYGSNVDSFEEKLEACFGVPDVALVNSGTSAIHLSLVLSGVERGDEVIVQTLNFAGCINPIYYQGATPIFVDSERDTWNMDPALTEEAIKASLKRGVKPKVIVGVHLFGIPCQLDALLEISRRYDIPFIEDSADALGSRYKGEKVGGFGKFGVFSFNGNKIVTTSGGGALLAQDDAEMIRRAKHLSNQARRLEPHYVHDQVGYNYMFSNILAGLGTAQMDVLEERMEARRRIYDTYRSELSDVEELHFPDDPKDAVPNRWLSTVLVRTGKEARDGLYYHLRDQNIESRPVWNPMHLQPAYKGCAFFGGDTAESLFREGLCLPSGSGLTESQQLRVIESVREYFQATGVSVRELRMKNEE